LIGLDALSTSLTGLQLSELVLWLESGLRSLRSEESAEGCELAFSPLILLRDQPPMQQFHSAVDAMPGFLQARLRWACGQLLGSLRIQDDVEYARTAWSLAVAFKPPAGVLPAARRYIADLPRDAHDFPTRRPIIDAIVSAVLGYPRSEDQDAFMADLRRGPFWSSKYTRQHVLHLIKGRPRDWISIVQSFNNDLQSLSNTNPSFFRRLAKAIGPAHLALGSAELTRSERLDWLRLLLKPHFNIWFCGDRIAAKVGHDSVVLNEDEFDGLSSDEQAETLLSIIEPGGSGDAMHAQERLAVALSDPRLEQLINISAARS